MNKLMVIDDSIKLYKDIEKFLMDNPNYGFLTEYILKTAMSVSSNIAEGNKKTRKAFNSHLLTSKGSIVELRIQLQLIRQHLSSEIIDLIDKIEKTIIKLIQRNNIFIKNGDNSAPSSKLDAHHKRGKARWT